jgi:hypothetical protein
VATVIARLTEGGLQVRRVGHGTTRSIHQPDASAAPGDRRTDFVPQVLADLSDAGPEHRQRQTPAGLAIGARVGRARPEGTGRRLPSQGQRHRLAAGTPLVLNWFTEIAFALC